MIALAQELFCRFLEKGVPKTRSGTNHKEPIMRRFMNKLENLAAAVAFAENGDRVEAMRLANMYSPMLQSPNSKVLLATGNGGWDQSTTDYMAGLVERMHCDILALSVFPTVRSLLDASAVRGATQSFERIARRIRPSRVVCLHQVVSGTMCHWLRNACKKIKHLEFAVIQAEKGKCVSCALPIPMFYLEP